MQALELPNTFVGKLIPVPPEIMGKTGQDTLGQLNERGFGMYIGARQADLPEFRRVASQPSVSKNCPEDLSRRFKNEEMYKRWIETPGRIIFQIRKLGQAGLTDSVLAAYTWTRPGRYTEAPGCGNDYMFAIRVSEDFGRQGLGLLATLATISASVSLDPGRGKIGLKTRKDNENAIKLYLKAGAVLADETDSNVFMNFPWTYER